MRGRGKRKAMGALLDRFKGNISPAALLTSTFFWSWFDVVPLGGAIFQGIAGSVNLLPLAVSLAVSVLVLLCAAGAERWGLPWCCWVPRRAR